jgi:decaprenyl-phosphate phosphoribosyltransferase
MSVTKGDRDAASLRVERGSLDVGGLEPDANAPKPMGLARGWFKALRPKQWIKSVLVPAAPAAAGVLGNGTMLWHTVVAVITFSLCASGGYLINDAADVESDRRHPKKRFRPIAAGVVPVAWARIVGILLVAASIAAGGLLTSWKLSAVLGGYVVLTFSYSTWLKHVPVLEMMLVAGGFLLRPIAGAAATDVPLSQWFLIVASFGSLYMVAGKRTAEATEFGEEAASHRRILQAYPVAYLRQTRELAAAVTLLAYCLWAFERGADLHNATLSKLSIIPVTFGLLRYQLLLERGQGGAPEEAVLGDPPLLFAGLAFVITFALGVYLK